MSEKNEKESHFRGDDDYEFLMPETHKYEPETSEEKDENLKKIDEKNTKIIVTIHYPSYKFLSKDILDEFKFLDKFKIETAQRNFISVLMKNQYGEYDFEPLDIKVPKQGFSIGDVRQCVGMCPLDYPKTEYEFYLHE